MIEKITKFRKLISHTLISRVGSNLSTPASAATAAAHTATMKSQLAGLKSSSPGQQNLPRPSTNTPSSSQKLSAAAASLGQAAPGQATPGGAAPNQANERMLADFFNQLLLKNGPTGRTPKAGSTPSTNTGATGT